MIGSGDVITWCGDPSMAAAALLQRAGRIVSRIAAEGAKLADQRDRSDPFPTDPVERAGWYERREGWRRHEIGSPVMDGLNLPRLPWGPEPIALIAELSAFALASLERIDALHKEARNAESEAAGWKQKHAALTAAAERAASDSAAKLRATEDVVSDLRAQLASALVDVTSARHDALDAIRDRDAALSQAEAWRASAQVQSDAMAMLRAALRIPTLPENGAQTVPALVAR